MGIKADKRYNGTVSPGSTLMESQSGTLGFQVMLECEDGETSYTIWLTPRSKEIAVETFKNALGIDPKKLEDGNYLELQLATDIAGREVTFTTREEEYKGKSTTKVVGLFKRNVSSGLPLGKAASSFFKGTGLTPQADKFEATDADVPF